MKELVNQNINIFDIAVGVNQAVCVTTNGEIRVNGCAVMGKGIALEAKQRFNGMNYQPLINN